MATGAQRVRTPRDHLLLTTATNTYTHTVARTPAKLRKMLQDTHNISPSTIDTFLTVIQGDVRDETSVKAVLAPHNQPAAIIISGLGVQPTFQLSLTQPVKVEPGFATICQDGVSTILSCVRALRLEGTISAVQKPLMVVISTTGTQREPRDVPLVYYHLYHWMLKVPHADKRAMESMVVSAATGQEASLRAFAIVRPTLLFDGEGRGLQRVKVGWVRHPEDKSSAEKAPGPAIGYKISRADVGAFLFAELVKKEAQGWENKAISLAY